MAIPNSNVDWQAEPVASAVNYQREWKAFAVRRNLAFLLVFGWIPVCVGLFWLSRLWLHQPVACLLMMAVWLACAVAAVIWVGEFRCPRCRRRYGALGHGKGDTNFTRGLFDKVCSNCNLRKFEVVR